MILKHSPVEIQLLPLLKWLCKNIKFIAIMHSKLFEQYIHHPSSSNRGKQTYSTQPTSCCKQRDKTPNQQLETVHVVMGQDLQVSFFVALGNRFKVLNFDIWQTSWNFNHCGVSLTSHTQNQKPLPIKPSWWFQPIWKILVKLDHFPRDRDENNKYLKPPPRNRYT